MPTPVPKNGISELYFLASLSQRSQRPVPGTAPSGPPVGFCAPPILGAVRLLMERTATEETYFIVCKSPDPPRQHTNTHKHTQIHTNTHRYTQIHTSAHKYTQIHTNTHRYTQRHTNTHKYTQIHTDTHRYTPPSGGVLFSHFGIFIIFHMPGHFVATNAHQRRKLGARDYIFVFWVVFGGFGFVHGHARRPIWALCGHRPGTFKKYRRDVAGAGFHQPSLFRTF